MTGQDEDLPDADEQVPERKHVDGPERSVMRELLSPDEIRHLEVAEGRWLLPGPTP